MTVDKDPDLQSQAEVLAFLRDPASHGGIKPREIVTHISRIFLVGDRALKLKRAVKLPFVDFSELDTRIQTCRREVALNRRTIFSATKTQSKATWTVNRIQAGNGGL